MTIRRCGGKLQRFPSSSFSYVCRLVMDLGARWRDDSDVGVPTCDEEMKAVVTTHGVFWLCPTCDAYPTTIERIHP